MTARTPALLVAVLAVAACSSKRSTTPGSDHPGPTGDDDAQAIAVPPPPGDAAPARVVLPAPPPVPAVPHGLPAATVDATPAQVALGELLFFEPRLSKSGALACASCHDPDHGYGSPRVRDRTDAGELDLRHTPALANLYLRKAFAWDGRYDDLGPMIEAHARGQLGQALELDAPWLLASPTYEAHLERLGVPVDDQDGEPAIAPAVTAALAAYVVTRYAGGAPWDRFEAGDRTAASPAAVRGYALFSGRAQCSVCHLPPLYTDLRYHALGLIAQPDEGRGRVEPGLRGAFLTPTVRGAALHPPYFHDGSAPTLAAAVGWHLDGGTGQHADRSIVDPALRPVRLSPAERADLLAFVRALSPDPAPPPVHRPELP
jgi:cytochrome c peroxidase